MPKFYEPEVLKKVQETELSILKDFAKICEKHNLTWFGIAGTGIGALRHQGFIPWDDDIDIAMPRKDYYKLLRYMRMEMGDKYDILNAENYEHYPLMTTRIVLRGTIFREEALKDVNCPFGIFLDLYPYDNLADNEFLYNLQVWSAWFFSKLMILREVPHPYLGFTGAKAAVVQKICGFVHGTMKALHIPKKFLFKSCEKICMACKKKHTRRIGFPGDTDPNWNTIDTSKMYPLRELPFEDVMIPFPNNLEEILTDFYGDYMQMPPVEKRKTHYPHELSFGEYGNE